MRTPTRDGGGPRGPRLQGALYSLLLLASACGRPHTSAVRVERPTVPAQLLPSLSGLVMDATGAPVSGALVAAIPIKNTPHTAEPLLARSGVDGTFAFREVPNGRYALTATAAGKVGAYKPNIEASRGAPPVRLDLGDRGVRISGRITSLRGDAIAGSVVAFARFSDFDGDTWYGVADHDGRFAVTLPNAHYQLTARARGFIAMSLVTMEDTPERNLDFELEPEDASRFAGPSVIEQLRAHAIVTTTDPTADLADLEPLRALVTDDVRVVGLGEPLHGGREIFQLKHRLLRFLVEKLGFTILGIEASWPDTRVLNDYVLTGKGDPAQLVGRMRFWIWDNEELVEVLRWMRSYNADGRHERKLQFHGFDMQFSPTAMKAIRDYLATADPAFGRTLDPTLIATADEFETDHIYAWSRARRAQLSTAAAALLKHFDDDKAAMIRRTSAAKWEEARHHAEIIVQFVELCLADGNQRTVVRDRAMQENALWLLDHVARGARVALWADNLHLAKGDPFGATPSMGMALAQRLGRGYVAIGSSFWGGTFRAMSVAPVRGMMTFAVPSPPPRGSLEGTLGQIDGDVIGIDLDRLPKDSDAGRWARYRIRARSIGAAYSESWGDSMLSLHPAELYDAFFLVRQLTPSHYLGPIVKPRDPIEKPANLDFETGGEAPPRDWYIPQFCVYSGYRATTEATTPFEGQHDALLARSGFARMPGYGLLEQTIRAAGFAGHRVRLRAAVRVEGARLGDGAHLFVDSHTSDGQPIDFVATPLLTSNRWSTFDVELEVSRNVADVRFGLAVTGDARAWIDAVSFAPIADQPPRQ